MAENIAFRRLPVTRPRVECGNGSYLIDAIFSIAGAPVANLTAAMLKVVPLALILNAIALPASHRTGAFAEDSDRLSSDDSPSGPSSSTPESARNVSFLLDGWSGVCAL
jgi:hypothetical protein